MIQSAISLNEAKPLPDGWRWVRLGDVCMINPSRPNGFTRLPDASTTFVPMAAVDGNLGVISKPESRSYSEVSTGYTYFGEADVLFAKITPCMQNGKHAIARNLLDGVGFGSTEFHVIRPSALILPEWIHFFIRQSYFLREATSYFVGAVGQQRVPESFLANYGIPLPSLPEQKQIAAKVQEMTKEVERARIACEAQLEAASALSQAYLRQVFESEEAEKWERRRLGEVCEIIMGQSPPGDTYNRSGEGLPFFQGKLDFGEIYPTASFWCTHPQKIAEPGDVLISVRAPVGPTNLCNQKSCIGRGLATIRSRNNGEPLFVLHFLRFIEKSISEIGQGSTFGAIKRSDLEGMSFPFPPLTTQQRIAAELKDKMVSAEKLKAAIEKELETIKALPQAILRKAFRGEL